MFGHYDEGLSRYETLAEFYDSTHQAHVSLTAAMQMDDMQYLEDYEAQMNKARHQIHALRQFESFRFGLLENMLDTYDETVDKMLIEQELQARQSLYDDLIRLDMLITDTQSNSYSLLTEINTLSKDTIKEEANDQFRNILIITAVVLVLSTGFIIYSYHEIIHPVNKLVGNANKLKNGDFDIEPVNNSTEEMRILSDSFGDMAISLKANLESIKEKSRLEKRIVEQENETLRIGKVMAETRLSVFQRQINSHFLFNTLSVIAKLAYIEGALKTNELMVITSDLLRYSVEKSGKISTLSEEIQCCRNYIMIQTKRFGKRINFILDADPYIEDIRMPAMLIQPIIENAVLHGVGDMLKGAMIEIGIKFVKGRLQIKVRDNGIGIPKVSLEILRQLMSESNTSKSNGNIGLNNVKSRLNMFYGENVTLDINSEEGIGTEVVIEIRELDRYRSEAPDV